MKTFLSFLLTIMVVTAAAAPPSRSDNHELKPENLEKNIPQVERLKKNVHHQIQEQKKRLLKEIVNDINVVKNKLPEEILDKWVPDVLQKSCTPEDICKAGNLLVKFEANDLGLEKREWMLPWKLLAYTKGTDCSKTRTETDDSTLSSLLQKIHKCAQKSFLELTSTS